jgi:hypothetical protein
MMNPIPQFVPSTEDAMHIIFARILFITQKDQIEGREKVPFGDLSKLKNRF